MLEGIEQILIKQAPSAVVVFGDTNSTLAGALAAAKLHITLVHVEAGLRSFNRLMPEEINRVATDHMSDLLLAPTPTAVRNLRAENLAERTVFTGDVMYDAVLGTRELARRRSQIMRVLNLRSHEYGVVTLHRAENTTLTQLEQLLGVLNEVASHHLPLVFPIHPRTAQLLRTGPVAWSPDPAMRMIDPLGYMDMIRLIDEARLVLTDSGGMQKEAFFLGCPCITLRSETEWTETVEAGANIVTGTDRRAVLEGVRRWLAASSARYEFGSAKQFAFGNGNAAQATVSALLKLQP
jgi:UDP-GlcNAc3NAcA epimerase